MSKTTSSRWFVDVLESGGRKQRFCVEATSWKHALHTARQLSGQHGSKAKFRFERRADGHHARDLSGAFEFFISSAPAGASLSTTPTVTTNSATPKPKFRRLFRILGSLRPPLRASRGSQPIDESHGVSSERPPSGVSRSAESLADADAAATALPSSPWGSSPLATAGRPGEYLIGKLFEQMHDLLFMPDLISGATFLTDVLVQRIPCAGVLIHVFDINHREFVVVRAKGPREDDVLMHRSADQHPIFSEALQRQAVLHVNVAKTKSFDTERWRKLGLVVSEVLCGPVHHGRRYLGVVELANPLGDKFSDSQAHALEYVCNQFADFVASRPIVLDEDAIFSGRASAPTVG